MFLKLSKGDRYCLDVSGIFVLLSLVSSTYFMNLAEDNCCKPAKSLLGANSSSSTSGCSLCSYPCAETAHVRLSYLAANLKTCLFLFARRFDVAIVASISHDVCVLIAMVVLRRWYLANGHREWLIVAARVMKRLVPVAWILRAASLQSGSCPYCTRQLSLLLQIGEKSPLYTIYKAFALKVPLGLHFVCATLEWILLTVTAAVVKWKSGERQLDTVMFGWRTYFAGVVVPCCALYVFEACCKQLSDPSSWKKEQLASGSKVSGQNGSCKATDCFVGMDCADVSSIRPPRGSPAPVSTGSRPDGIRRHSAVDFNSPKDGEAMGLDHLSPPHVNSEPPEQHHNGSRGLGTAYEDSPAPACTGRALSAQRRVQLDLSQLMAKVAVQTRTKGSSALYQARLKTRVVSVKVQEHPEDFNAFSARLESRVREVAQDQAGQGGSVVVGWQAVCIQGCVQLLMVMSQFDDEDNTGDLVESPVEDCPESVELCPEVETLASGWLYEGDQDNGSSVMERSKLAVRQVLQEVRQMEGVRSVTVQMDKDMMDADGGIGQGSSWSALLDRKWEVENQLGLTPPVVSTEAPSEVKVLCPGVAALARDTGVCNIKVVAMRNSLAVTSKTVSIEELEACEEQVMVTLPAHLDVAVYHINVLAEFGDNKSVLLDSLPLLVTIPDVKEEVLSWFEGEVQSMVPAMMIDAAWDGSRTLCVHCQLYRQLLGPLYTDLGPLLRTQTILDDFGRRTSVIKDCLTSLLGYLMGQQMLATSNWLVQCLAGERHRVITRLVQESICALMQEYQVDDCLGLTRAVPRALGSASEMEGGEGREVYTYLPFDPACPLVESTISSRMSIPVHEDLDPCPGEEPVLLNEGTDAIPSASLSPGSANADWAEAASEGSGTFEENAYLIPRPRPRRRSRRPSTELAACTMLGFLDAEVEAEYLQYKADRSFWADALAMAFYLAFLCNGVIMKLGNIPLANVQRMRWKIKMCSVVIMGLAQMFPYFLAMLKPRMYKRHRETLVLISRAFTGVVACLTGCGVLLMPDPWRNLLQATSTYRTVAIVLYPIFTQVRFRAHVLSCILSFGGELSLLGSVWGWQKAVQQALLSSMLSSVVSYMVELCWRWRFMNEAASGRDLFGSFLCKGVAGTSSQDEQLEEDAPSGPPACESS